MDLVEIFKFLDSLEDKVGQHILCCDENRFKGDYYAIKIISNKKNSRGIRCEVVGFDRKGEININKFLGWLFNGRDLRDSKFYICNSYEHCIETMQNIISLG